MQQNMRIKKMDDWKWIAAFLVVAIHTSPLESISKLADFVLTRELARIAVPLFFMITGYFSLQKNKLAGSVKRLLLLYLGVTVLYLPVQIYRYLPLKQVAVSDVLKNLLRAVFFDGTYYHLWYMPAVIEGLLIVYFLLKLGRRTAFILSSLLYVIGLLGDSYYGWISQNPVLRQVYEWMFGFFSQTRNGLFFAPIFLLLGYEISLAHIKRKQRALSCFLLWLFLMVVEGLLLHFAGWQRYDSMYLCLPFCMFFLFLYLTAEKKQVPAGFISAKMKEGPMLLYFIHPYAILLLRGFVKVTGLSFILSISPIYYVAVLTISIVFVIVFMLWQQRRKCKKGETYVSEG
ncbi:MAG TPA: acyltransferase [Lachnospiraceae bacterium]|nr:acyltransferase [Lachnospiraceae bacterium]